jgi:hypothetical protein
MIFCLGVLSALDTCQQLRLITIPMICLDSSWSAYVEITVPMTLLYFQLIIYSKYVFMLLNVNDFYLASNTWIIIPPLPEGGGGIYMYTVLLLSVCPSFRPSVRPSKICFVAFFSVTIDGRNLIFGHNRHIGIPYCG